MSPPELAAYVCQALADAGIKVTLTGGACVAIWSGGAYESVDLDFVEQGLVSRREIRSVLTGLGFSERHRYFKHPGADVVIEFPSGPLAVGNEPVGDVVEQQLPTGLLRLLSPTDCVKDRLSAWFHWDDRQALDQALLVSKAQRIDMADIRRWSKAEGRLEAFDVFRRRAVDRQ